MARRRKRKSRNDDYPGWVWMMFGLSIGLAVAFAQLDKPGAQRFDSMENLGFLML